MDNPDEAGGNASPTASFGNTPEGGQERSRAFTVSALPMVQRQKLHAVSSLGEAGNEYLERGPSIQYIHLTWKSFGSVGRSRYGASNSPKRAVPMDAWPLANINGRITAGICT